MSSTPVQRKPSLKRRTWPQSEPGHLETIIESPRTPQEARLSSTDVQDTPPRSRLNSQPQDSKQNVSVEKLLTPADATHTQMIWYSHHLAQSYSDRERLAGKIEQLEDVCRYQSKTNASLLDDIRTWRNNYETVESELIEATQEMEEAKAYVRSVETANANLRYALSQAKEEQERVRRKRWRTCGIEDSWKRLRSIPRRVSNAVCGASALKTTSPQPEKPSRVVDAPSRSTSRIHLLGSRNCSRVSQVASQILEARENPQRRAG